MALIVNLNPARFSVAGKPIHYAWAMVAVASGLRLSGSAVRTSFSVLVPRLVDTFGWSVGAVGGILAVQWIFGGLFSPLAGWLGDRYGYRRTMAIGAVLFAFGSYLNEVLFKTGILGDSVLKYVSVSLLLALGIGMVSGAAQHFYDTPVFASYIAPIGIFVSSLAFAIRQGYVLHRRNWAFMIMLGVVFATVFHLALRSYASSLPVSVGHHGVAAAAMHGDAHDDGHDHDYSAPDHGTAATTLGSAH